MAAFQGWWIQYLDMAVGHGGTDIGMVTGVFAHLEMGYCTALARLPIPLTAGT